MLKILRFLKFQNINFPYTSLILTHQNLEKIKFMQIYFLLKYTKNKLKFKHSTRFLI